MDTMTTHNLGQMPGGVRRGAVAPVVCTIWRERSVAPAFGAPLATGGRLFPMHAYLGNSTTLAGAENGSFIERPARHLARGST